MAGLALFTLSPTSIQTACHSLLISIDVFLSFRNSFCRVVIQKKNNPLTKHPAEEMPFNSKNVCLFTFFSHEMLPFIVDRYSLLNGAPSLLSIDNSQRFFLSLLVCSQIKPPTSNGHQF
jgi:hypothetical protein